MLAVGSTYAWPFRALSHMLDEAVKPFAEAQQKLKDYKRIVIVGGGPAGIEYAGVSHILVCLRRWRASDGD